MAYLLLTVTALAGSQPAHDGYHIAPGDVLQVIVFGEDQLTGEYRVGPVGTLTMPLIGNILVGGRQLSEAETIIGTELRRMIKRPVVTVALNEQASERKVYLSGEVSRTGPFALPFGATVADALAAAAPLPTADLRAVRVTNSTCAPRVLDFSGLREDRSMSALETVRYGDVIFIPRLTTRISVLGEVCKPGEVTVPLGERVTVLDAVGRLGGGLTAGADHSAALLLRVGEPTRNIDLRALLQEGDLSQNVELRSGDVLVVRAAGRVSVLGEVRSPAMLEIAEPTTVVETLARAGGVTADADLRHAQVITAQGTVPIDLEALLLRGDMRYNLAVNRGDVLLVPRAGPETVLILGEVKQPNIINIREQEQRDLLRLLTIAGPTELADLERVQVYRENERLVVDMRAVMVEGELGANIALQPDDVVMVPQLNTIYVMGAANAGGPVPVAPDLSLYDVVVRFANNPVADLGQITVMRVTERGETEFLQRNMTGIARGREPENLTLQQGDVVFIPFKSQGIGWGQVRDALWTIGSVLGLLSQL